MARVAEKGRQAPCVSSFVHAVLYLAAAPKSRVVDHALIVHYEAPREHREIPDFALDLHTSRSRTAKRAWKHFWEEGARLEKRTFWTTLMNRRPSEFDQTSNSTWTFDRLHPTD